MMLRFVLCVVCSGWLCVLCFVVCFFCVDVVCVDVLMLVLVLFGWVGVVLCGLGWVGVVVLVGLW